MPIIWIFVNLVRIIVSFSALTAQRKNALCHFGGGIGTRAGVRHLGHRVQRAGVQQQVDEHPPGVQMPGRSFSATSNAAP